MKLQKLFFILGFFVANYSILYGQTTYSPTLLSKNNDCIIEKIQLTDDETIVTINVPSSKKKSDRVFFSSATVLMPTDGWNINAVRESFLDYPDVPPIGLGLDQLYYDAVKRVREGRTQLSKAGFLIRSLGNDQLDAKYKTYSKEHRWFKFELHFDRLPYGCENVFIRELAKNGWEWVGIQVNNPYPNIPNVGLNEIEIKKKIEEQNNGISGIYEGCSGHKYKLACFKDSIGYKLIYLDDSENFKHWNVGDVKAVLIESATPGLFKANWYLKDKTLSDEYYAIFDGGNMKIIAGELEDLYIKMYPKSRSSVASSFSQEWTGTGFALNGGYITTNYHVVEDAKSIKVRGIKGDFNTEYNASIVSTDKINDLAIIKINDSRFKGFGTIPYSIKTTISEVGESVFVLGYPLTTTMGSETKLGTGIISSKTGFQGDISLYQISAPTQPGNSGGPLFDTNGNLIGIVNAKHRDTENVSYAIKATYLKNLIECTLPASLLPTSNIVSGMSLSNKVKAMKKFVFLISCSSINSTSSSNTTDE